MKAPTKAEYKKVADLVVQMQMERDAKHEINMKLRARIGELEQRDANLLAETERANAACRKLSLLRTIIEQG